MKIRSWLLISYFVVMLLPLVAAYFLFAWINMYHDDLHVEEYIHKSLELQHTASILNDPALYKPFAERTDVEALISDTLAITLYNRDGLLLYTSDPTNLSQQVFIGKETLYKSLYSVEQGYRAYHYKQPVFHENELVGFFEIQLSRNEWQEGVVQRTQLITVMFIVLFALIYLTVVYFIHRKLGRRLHQLMKQMTAFAQNEDIGQMRSSKDEIGQLAAHFYRMTEEIIAVRRKVTQQQQDKEFLIASISHDLKTPLTSIRAYTESLAADEGQLTANERADYLNIIVNKTNVIKDMLDDLTMYTLLQSPSYELDMTTVDSNEFFEMLMSDYDALCKEKNITLHTLRQTSGNIEVHPQQMMRVANNLMANAIQHTFPGGHIWMAAISTDQPLPEQLFDFATQQLQEKVDQEGIYFIIQNEGKGIREEQLPFVFDPLYQADPARTKQQEQGTGLGLSITKQIIEKHGGTVRIFSKLAIGTCIVCYLDQSTKT